MGAGTSVKPRPFSLFPSLEKRQISTRSPFQSAGSPWPPHWSPTLFLSGPLPRFLWAAWLKWPIREVLLHYYSNTLSIFFPCFIFWHSTYHHLTYDRYPCLWSVWSPWKQGLFSLSYPQHLKQCLAQKRGSIKTCWMNESCVEALPNGKRAGRYTLLLLLPVGATLPIWVFFFLKQ